MLGPICNGSSAAIWAGVFQYQPEGTEWVPLKPRTLPPGHATTDAHWYIRMPSRKEFDGTALTRGVSLFSLRLSKLRKKNSRLLRMGPPAEAPPISLSSFGAVLGSPEPSCASCRKYSLLDVPVRRNVQ